MNIRRRKDVQNKSYHNTKQPNKMTPPPTTAYLLVLVAAAALSSADAFSNLRSVRAHHLSLHPNLSQLHLSAIDEEIPLDVVSASDIPPAENAKDMLKVEMSEVGPEGIMPFAPMMTFSKYLTMQEKRVKVTIRYSADAGLRPFYLTVASRIKSAHPDVILEKRILPNPAGSEIESIFEVLVDGKTVIGKKKTKLLKVRTSSSSSSSRNEEEDDEKKTKDNEATDSDIAGGRSIFVSMEKLEQELNKARKKRRPSTMYKSKQLLRSSGDGSFAGVGGVGEEGIVSGTSEAVLRLEKLKAMSSRKS